MLLLAVAFVIYLVDASTEKVERIPKVRDSVALCRELEDFNKDWRELAVSRIPRALEIKQMTESESSVFQTLAAELLVAEIEMDQGASVGIRREMSQICDSPASTPLPP